MKEQIYLFLDHLSDFRKINMWSIRDQLLMSFSDVPIDFIIEVWGQWMRESGYLIKGGNNAG